MAGRFLSVFTAIFVFSFSLQVQAVEFRGAEYDVYLGDVNGDGIDDIYLKVPDIFVLLHGDISVPLLIDSDLPSYLVESVNGVYQYYSSPIIDETIDTQALTLSNGIASLSDQNFDGIHDLYLSGGGLLYSFAIDGDPLQPVNVVFTEYEAPSISTAATDPANDSLSGGEYLGALRGNYKVGQNGAFNYQLPIELPPGINGVEPNISLTYNSNRKNGYVGWGWNLSGISVIERCNSTPVRDGKNSGVNDNDDYKYCLDGKRLIEVSKDEYRFEDEKFSKIYAQIGDGTPVYWEVHSKDGSVSTYGKQDDSRIDGNLVDNPLDSNAPPQIINSYPYKYYLDEKKDVNGNYVDYKYNADYPNQTHKIESIEYTKVAPGNLGLSNKVEFLYEERDDEIVWYQSGHRYQILDRLSEIKVSVGGVIFSVYDLDYQDNEEVYFGKTNYDPVNISRLSSIEQCFGDGEKCLDPVEFDWNQRDSSQSNLSSLEVCENAEYLDVVGSDDEEANSKPIDYDGDGNSELLVMSKCGTNDPVYYVYPGLDFYDPNPTWDYPEGGYCFYLIDENSLHVQDVTNAHVVSNDVDFTLYNSDGTFADPGEDDAVERARVIDLNGDGLEDAIFSSANFVNGFRAFLSDGSGLIESSEYSMSTSSGDSNYMTFFVDNQSIAGQNVSGHLYYSIKFIDMNGDGLLDIYRAPPVTPSPDWYSIADLGDPFVSVALNTGTGYGDFTAWANLTEYDNINDPGLNWEIPVVPFVEPSLVDVNGDRLIDMVGYSGEVGINTGSSFTKVDSWSVNLPNGYAQYNPLTTRFGDVNGDGLKDLVAVRPNGVNVALNTGTEFSEPVLWSDSLVQADFWSIQNPRYQVSEYSFRTGDGFQNGGADPISGNHGTGYSTALGNAGFQPASGGDFIFQINIWFNISQSQFGAFQLRDVNKDGKDDILFGFRPIVPEAGNAEAAYRKEAIELFLSDGHRSFRDPIDLNFPVVDNWQYADIVDQDYAEENWDMPSELDDYWMPLNGIPYMTKSGNLCYQYTHSMFASGEDTGVFTSMSTIAIQPLDVPTKKQNYSDKFVINGDEVILPGRKGYAVTYEENTIVNVVEKDRSISVGVDRIDLDVDFYSQDQGADNSGLISFLDYGVQYGQIPATSTSYIKETFLSSSSKRRVVTRVVEDFGNISNIKEYEYGNYGEHLSGYGDLGFGFIKEVSIRPEADLVVEKHYSQIVGDNYKLSRKLLSSKTYAVIPTGIEGAEPAIQVLNEVENRWKTRIYNDDRDGVETGTYGMCKLGGDCPFIMGETSPHYFSYLYESISKSWDLDGSKIGDQLKAVYDPESKDCEFISDGISSVTENGGSEDVDFDEHGTPLISSSVSCSHESSTSAVVANVIHNSDVTSIETPDLFVSGLIQSRSHTSYVGASSTELDHASRSETFTYTDKGQVHTETVASAGTIDEKKTTTYSYNSYGSVSGITESWLNAENNGLTFTSRTSSIVETIDAGGNRKVELISPLNTKHTTIYEPRYGNKTSETDENDLTRNSFYDELGRLTGSDYADGTTSQIDYRTCNNCFEDFNSTAEYYVQTKQSGQSAVREYYDFSGQSVGVRAKNFDGSFVYTVYEYDNLGRISKEFLPRFESGAESSVVYQYDVMDRNTETNFPDGTSNTMVYSGLTQTITNQLDQVKTIIVNASGWTVKSEDDSSVSIAFSYWPFGELKSSMVNDDALTVVNMEYDSLGRQTSLDDPNTGEIKYRFNPLGKISEITDANGTVTRFGFDELERQTLRVDDATANNPENRTHHWLYDEKEYGAGLLSRIVGFDTDGVSYEEEYDYNEYSFPEYTTTTIDGRDFVFKNFYDNYSRPLATQYPTGYTVVNKYNDYGFRSGVRDTVANYDIWSALEMNVWGTINLSEFGNDLSLTVENDLFYGRISSISVSDGVLKAVDQRYDFDSLGNLKQRTDLVHSITQNLCYDNLNRLKSSRVGEACDTHTDNAYDDLGNIKSKKGISGSFSYGQNGAGPHAVTTANGMTYSYDNNGNMTSAKSGNTTVRSVSYSPFGKPTIIDDNGNSTRLVYSPNQDRIKRIDGNGRTTTYAGPGIYEENNDNGLIEKVHYIDDMALYISESGPQDGFYTYLHRDHIGSIVAKTGENVGSVNDVEYLSNDSWGRRVNENWVGSPIENGYVPSDTSRGFTDHEHLDQVGLIHMNGRVYDPVIGRFLSPDPLVQAPYNSQSYNRYTYVFNNPLSFVDPTGYSAETEEVIVTERQNRASDFRVTDFHRSMFSALDIDLDSITPFDLERINDSINVQVAITSDAACGSSSGGGWCDQTMVQFGEDLKGAFSLLASRKLTEAQKTKLAGALATKVVTGKFAPVKGFFSKLGGKIKNTYKNLFGSTRGKSKALRPVGSILESVNDVLANPQILAGKTPAQVQASIGKTPGWKVEKLRKGSRKGEGWVFREYNSKGKLTGQVMRWHPGSSRKGGAPYWRVTDLVNGKSDPIF
ncbi:MAG: hypothetical protein K6L81_05405 [Agarilytica sp.]